ncbi:hypothetical protein PSTT_14775, partial [Puccinia striiformis]
MALLSCLLLCRAISPIALVCFTLRYTLAAPFLDVSTAPIFQTIVPLANLPLQDLQPYKPYQVDLAPFSRQKKFSLKHQVGRTLTCKYQENKILAKIMLATPICNCKYTCGKDKIYGTDGALLKETGCFH